MSLERCLIDGTRLKQCRRQKGWSQKTLARKAGIAVRKLLDIENNRGVYDRDTVSHLAKALGVDAEELVLERDIDWRAVPKLPTRAERDLVAKAIRLDMEGKHHEAVQLCRDVLERGNPAADKRLAYPELHIRLISILDNAGEHEKALAECETFLNKLPAGLARESRWARYHRGICERRLGHLSQAGTIFLQLLSESDRGSVSVLHQLGVLSIQLAKSDATRAARHLDEAVEYFKTVIRKWDELAARTKEVPHRKGYTLLRLAEVYGLQGRTDAAIEMCIEALTGLAWHHCRRYVEEASRELQRLIRSRGLPLDGQPLFSHDPRGRRSRRAAPVERSRDSTRGNSDRANA